MKEQKLNFQDESGDKEFFTIIPNYVLNHSTVWDRSLYIQMKRVAGDDGECWMSLSDLADKTGISKSQVKKSLDYLLDKKWISLTGRKKVFGGSVGIYKIMNIWHLNSDYYRGVHTKNTFQGVHTKHEGVHGKAKGVHTVATKKITEEDKEEDPFYYNASVAEKLNLNSLIEKFKSVNPTYERLYAKIPQRAALERLVKKFGRAEVEKMIDVLPQTNQAKYAPIILTPLQLEDKLGALVNFLNREKNNQPKIIKV